MCWVGVSFQVKAAKMQQIARLLFFAMARCQMTATEKGYYFKIIKANKNDNPNEVINMLRRLLKYIYK